MKAETVAAALIGKGGGRRMKAVTAAAYSNTGPERRKVRIEMRKR